MNLKRKMAEIWIKTIIKEQTIKEEFEINSSGMEILEEMIIRLEQLLFKDNQPFLNYHHEYMYR